MKENIKKILLIMPISTTHWGSKNTGGVDSVCQMLIKEIINKNNLNLFYRVMAVDTSNSQKITGNTIKLSDNVELVWVSRKTKVFGVIPVPTLCYLIYKARQQVKEFKPSLVNTHMWTAILGISRKTLSIVTLHSYKNIARKSVSPLNDWLYVKALPKLTRLFGNTIVCVGEQLKSAVTKDVKQDVQVIGNPIDDKYFTITTKKEISQVLRLVTCALLTPRKQVEKAILLTKRLNEQGIETQLTIIGPPSDKEYTQALKQQVEESDLFTKVHFLGRLNQQAIIAEYQQSDIGVFFSKEETFGLAPLEMLAAGLPLLSTEVGILAEKKEFFEKMGVGFVNVNNEDEMLVIAKQLIKSASAPNVTLLQSEFSVASVVNQYEALYLEHLSKC